jgi:uncharacterized surface protein with fasciclin (FAS1) repeats
MKKNLFNPFLNIRAFALVVLSTLLITSCKKESSQQQEIAAENQAAAVAAARELESGAAARAAAEGEKLQLSTGEQNRHENRNIVQIAVSNPNFSSLVAAVLKTNLAGALSNASANLTVFAPTNDAFAQLPAPFNNAANITAINDAGQIDFLRNVLLYHVVGAEVFSYQVTVGRSSAPTLKPAGSSNDNTIYFSKSFGLLRVNGQSDVILPNVDASNGVIHVINKVLIFPTSNIAQIAIGNPAFSSLVAALVKTNLASVFTGNGDFTVFAPTNTAFAQLPAPFNTAANISAINNQEQINTLANILKYHVIGERYFTWDLGILKRITTLADAPNNRVTTIVGYNTGWVKGIGNNMFSEINPGDILATNGVVHVIDRVLLP